MTYKYFVEYDGDRYVGCEDIGWGSRIVMTERHDTFEEALKDLYSVVNEGTIRVPVA